MFLRRLIIRSDSDIIRDIPFHKGLNLIVDNTPITDPKQTTGNNVGKTTVLRLVDFCLGGEGKNIYNDIEFHDKTNTTVETFLKNKNVIITLILVDDIDAEMRRIVIRRNFFSNKTKKILEINDESYSSLDSFRKSLQKLIFDSTVEKPTFRQMIAKNIRDEKSKMDNIVKVLHPTVRATEYEALYLFWLGIDTDNQKQKQEFKNEIAKEKSFIKRLENTGGLAFINQQQGIVVQKIEELNIKKENFNLNVRYENDIGSLNEVRKRLSDSASHLSQLKMRYNLIIESKEVLENERSNIDTKQIELLYKKAKAFIRHIHVSFEETVKFHNDLIYEKIKYITQELPKLKEEITMISNTIAELRNNEQEIIKRLRTNGVTEELERIIAEINRFYEKKGELEEKKKLLQNAKDNLERMEKELLAINNNIDTHDKLIESRVALFNKYFLEITNKLYGEGYILSAPKEEKGYTLSVDNWGGNPSTGKKKGQIAAFDFAYIQFAESIGIHCLHFVMHDQMESVHSNQLATLIDVANTLHGQYIVPILREKIPPNVNIRAFEVLSLSQNDKLFKIP
jgi:uncharacterized protein YydD (DUF2326 family)